MTTLESKNSVINTENHNLQHLGTLLQRCLITYNNLVIEYQDQQNELETYKKRYLALKQNCEIEKHGGCIANLSPPQELKLYGAELLGNLPYSTKNYLKDSPKIKDSNDPFKDSEIAQAISGEKCGKEDVSPMKNVESNDQSISDTNETPTGRCSPLLSLNSKVEKKKLSNNWKTPESKVVKLCVPSSANRHKPGRKLKQARFNFVHTKTSQIIDASNCSLAMEHNPDPMSNTIESIENDDTIFPSPTSGPVKLEFGTGNRNMRKIENLNDLLKSKSVTKCTSNESKCPLNKMEHSSPVIDTHSMKFEIESVNLLHAEKSKHIDVGKKSVEGKEEFCLYTEADSDISLGKHPEKNEGEKGVLKTAAESLLLKHGEYKHPLVENMNCDNIQTQFDTDVSVSLLKPVDCKETNKWNRMSVRKKENVEYIYKESSPRKKAEQKNCINTLKKENVEHFYKEPVPRKKAEKKALPGWNCDQCKNFYGVLHKDDPVMLEKRMLECSKHRGRTNPIQPHTPPGLWEPRWHVEEDTEAFNRQNNVT